MNKGIVKPDHRDALENLVAAHATAVYYSQDGEAKMESATKSVCIPHTTTEAL